MTACAGPKNKLFSEIIFTILSKRNYEGDQKYVQSTADHVGKSGEVRKVTCHCRCPAPPAHPPPCQMGNMCNHVGKSGEVRKVRCHCRSRCPAPPPCHVMGNMCNPGRINLTWANQARRWMTRRSP